MKQTTLYEPIRRWLVAEGFSAAVTGTGLPIAIPIGVFVSMPYKVPDIVGVRDGRVVLVEVEQERRRFFDALGRCMLWKCMASYVYLALPAGAVDRAQFLQKLGVGLLVVDETTEAVTAPIQLPREGLDFTLTQELHPLDPVAEQQLHLHIQATCV